MKNDIPLYGLVLAGGKSTRMGKDKGVLQYHQDPQREHAYNLLSDFCNKVYLSVRSDQTTEVPDWTQAIADRNEFRGPFNGLLSAHHLFPEAAWLVLACDLPLLDSATLRLLKEGRDPAKTATALATRKTGLPEPLAAIWEPEGLAQARGYLAESSSSCPRKYLLNSDVKLVFPEDDRVLANANDPESYRSIRSQLASK